MVTPSTSKMPLLPLLAALALNATVMPANAQAPVKLQPGFWEITTKPEFPGVPIIPVPKIDKLCLNKDDIAGGRIDLRSAPGCKVIGGKWIDNRLQLDIACGDAPPEAKMSGELIASGQTLTSKIDLISQPGQEGAAAGHFVYIGSGRLLAGDCPAPTLLTPDGTPVYQ